MPCSQSWRLMAVPESFLRMPIWISPRVSAAKVVEIFAELLDGFAGQADDQVNMQVGRSFLFKEGEIFPDPLKIKPAADVGRSFGVQGLDADLELQGAGEESGVSGP